MLADGSVLFECDNYVLADRGDVKMVLKKLLNVS